MSLGSSQTDFLIIKYNDLSIFTSTAVNKKTRSPQKVIKNILKCLKNPL
jgi:hypothetical protein